mgnify:CR=1 FL=1
MSLLLRSKELREIFMLVIYQTQSLTYAALLTSSIWLVRQSFFIDLRVAIAQSETFKLHFLNPLKTLDQTTMLYTEISVSNPSTKAAMGMVLTRILADEVHDSGQEL